MLGLVVVCRGFGWIDGGCYVVVLLRKYSASLFVGLSLCSVECVLETTHGTCE
jgi:hypothetical protein